MIESEEDKAKRLAALAEEKAKQEALRANNPKVYFDMTVGGEAAGRIEMELYTPGVCCLAQRHQGHAPAQACTSRVSRSE